MQFITQIPFFFLLLLCIVPGLAPFTPEPHIVEKLRMLLLGELRKSMDVFDLLFHSLPFVLLVAKLVTMTNRSSQ